VKGGREGWSKTSLGRQVRGRQRTQRGRKRKDPALDTAERKRKQIEGEDEKYGNKSGKLRREWIAGNYNDTKGRR